MTLPHDEETSVTDIGTEGISKKIEYGIHTHVADIKPGQTRLCNDPWTLLQVLGDGEVRPCCFTGVTLGYLSDQNNLEQIYNGTVAQNLRHQLLTGELDEYCKKCNMKAIVPISELRKEIESLYNKESLQTGTQQPSQQPNASSSVIGKLSQVKVLRQFAKTIFPQPVQNYLYKISH